MTFYSSRARANCAWYPSLAGICALESLSLFFNYVYLFIYGFLIMFFPLIQLGCFANEVTSDSCCFLVLFYFSHCPLYPEGPVGVRKVL